MKKFKSSFPETPKSVSFRILCQVSLEARSHEVLGGMFVVDFFTKIFGISLI